MAGLRAMFFGGERGADDLFARVYSADARDRLGSAYDIALGMRSLGDVRDPVRRAEMARVEVVFSSWGMPAFTADDLNVLPALRAVFYAAGTVQGFARPLLARGIVVSSSWAANAIPVAEFTLGQIILALKLAQRSMADCRAAGDRGGDPPVWRRYAVTGAYRSVVGLVSLGMIGRRVAEMLKVLDVRVIAYEPFAGPGVAGELGVELVSLEACFAEANVVSLHTPSLPATRGMVGGALLASMKPGATLINTARGALVDSAALFEVLSSRPDLTALIDVTDPEEPPVAGSRFYTTPNLLLTPHIAGSHGGELARLGDYAADEALRFARGEGLRWQVTEAMLDTMA